MSIQVLLKRALWAQASRIYLWFVVNRVAYGECLRLLLITNNKLKL